MVDSGDLSGKTLGNYKILSRIGRGGMAVVYKAHEMSLNRVVALKVIGGHLAEDQTFIDRFKREAQAAAQLNHPSIVQIFAIGQEEDVLFFTMEYVKGKTLQDVIKDDGPMNVERAIPMVRQVAEALAAAHDAGIVHRDIKSANVMVDTMDRVKVADFGVAQLASAGTKLTQTGCFVGTPEYISPEQCRGHAVDGRSDIYSLGVTFYEMLSGRSPFEADTPAALALRIVEGDCTSVGELNPSVPGAVVQVVEKMMCPDRDKRYQSAQEVVEALAALGVGAAEPVPAAVAAAAVAPGRARGRRIGPALLLSLVVVLLMASFTVWQLFGPERNEQESDRSSSSVVESTQERITAGAVVEPPQEETVAEEEGALAVAEIETEPDVTSQTASDVATAKPAAVAPPPPPALPVDPPVRQYVAPPPKTMIVTAGGDYEYVDQVSIQVEKYFTGEGFRLIDWQSSTAGAMRDVAAFHCVATAKVTGASLLTYLGKATEQYTVVLTMKVIWPGDGTIVAGPETVTVQHTAINAGEVLEKATRGLAKKLADQLR